MNIGGKIRRSFNKNLNKEIKEHRKKELKSKEWKEEGIKKERRTKWKKE